MIPIPLIVAGISAFGSYLANRKGSRTSESESIQELLRNFTDTTNFDTTEDSLPILGDEQQGLQSALIARVMNQLNNPDNNLGSIITQGIQNINAGGDARRIGLSRALASRGLSRSPAAVSAIAGSEGARISDVINFRNQAPLMADQIRRANIQQAGDIFSRIPTGRRTTRTGSTVTNQTGSQTSRGTGTQVGAGSAAGSGIGSLGTILAYLYGQGCYSSTKYN
jgi:hypothetical protein